ncbi:hypothetical protein UMZ34_17625 [Halopseudomonas pachastrellae]|nr:hypothetical protein UMZ34_17625 [Halopseudomonas pachastrellae]
MSHAYSAAHDRNSRNEEAYRLFSVTQNIAAEKETQRAALFDWENQLMFDQAVGQPGAHLPRILASEFGLWFRHKARMPLKARVRRGRSSRRWSRLMT